MLFNHASNPQKKTKTMIYRERHTFPMYSTVRELIVFSYKEKNFQKAPVHFTRPSASYFSLLQYNL